MNKKTGLLILILLLISPFVIAQSVSENASIDRTINYLDKINTLTTDWANAPEKKAFRKMLEDAVKSYDQIKKDITPVLVVSGEGADKKALQKLLDGHPNDRERLIRELLVWKYQPGEPAGSKLISQLDDITGKTYEFLLNFHDDEAVDDAVFVLLNQELAESSILPLSKKLIQELTKLKK